MRSLCKKCIRKFLHLFISDNMPQATLKYNEDLRKWFKQKWVNIGKKVDGKHPPCGTSGEKSAYAKCVPAAKAAGIVCIGNNTGNDLAALKQADFVINKYQDINLNKIISLIK